MDFNNPGISAALARRTPTAATEYTIGEDARTARELQGIKDFVKGAPSSSWESNGYVSLGF